MFFQRLIDTPIAARGADLKISPGSPQSGSRESGSSCNVTSTLPPSLSSSSAAAFLPSPPLPLAAARAVGKIDVCTCARERACDEDRETAEGEER